MKKAICAVVTILGMAIFCSCGTATAGQASSAAGSSAAAVSQKQTSAAQSSGSVTKTYLDYSITTDSTFDSKKITGGYLLLGSHYWIGLRIGYNTVQFESWEKTVEACKDTFNQMIIAGTGKNGTNFQTKKIEPFTNKNSYQLCRVTGTVSLDSATTPTPYVAYYYVPSNGEVVYWMTVETDSSYAAASEKTMQTMADEFKTSK